jgi:hypothetical protein
MVGQWSRLTLADIQLEAGTNRLLEDRKLANDELTEARETFQAILLESTEPTILERATFGLARASETLGDLEKARQEYQSLAITWPDSPFAATAKARAEDLKETPTKKFYDWLARYEPPPPLRNEPGTPGVGPNFLEEPDAGGILDTPLMKESKSGPALPSVIEQQGAAEGDADAPDADATPESPATPEAETPAAPAPEKTSDDGAASDESPAPDEPSAAEPSDEGPKLK